MKLYCKDNVILAFHDDGQDIPASAYGDGVTVLDIASWTDVPAGYTSLIPSVAQRLALAADG